MKKDPRTFKFVDLWMDVYRKGYNTFVGDQGCFMESTLRWANSSYDKSCMEDVDLSVMFRMILVLDKDANISFG